VVDGTSIIEVGLLRPAAAPGGRRVDGSRLGVAMLELPQSCVAAVGREDQHAGVKVMLFTANNVHCLESALAEMTSKGHGSNGGPCLDLHFHVSILHHDLEGIYFTLDPDSSDYFDTIGAKSRVALGEVCG
jgi:hypothetical protein